MQEVLPVDNEKRWLCDETQKSIYNNKEVAEIITYLLLDNFCNVAGCEEKDENGEDPSYAFESSVALYVISTLYFSENYSQFVSEVTDD